MTAGFGDKLTSRKFKTERPKYERTLSPLSEKEFSDEEEYQYN
jgi:hypothetical protein